MVNPSELRHFCGHLVRKYGSPDKASEEQKADEFRQYYLRNLPPTVRSLRAVARCCGLRIDKSEEMPEKVRGYNHVVNGTDNIVVRDGDTISGTQNTILHEIREIMERVFPGVCCDYDPLKTNALHFAANKFAAAVLLPGTSFEKKIYKSGFDIIELANSYSKSCSQVLLRIGEVLQGKLFFYACMYEPDSDNNWKVTYWTGSNNDDDLDANVYGLNSFFPRKYREVIPGSLVDMVIKEEKPHLVERIMLQEEGEDEGLVAIANPMMIQDKPAKVVLIVLLSSDRDLLSPQIERIDPTIIERFHQHL